MKNLILTLMLLFSFAALADVTTQSYSVTFSCTGSTGPYPFTFPVSAATALTVTKDGTLLGTSAYTITPVNNNYENGGNVTLNAACSSGSTLVLARVTPLTQTTVFTDNMPTPMKTFERSLDKLTEITQEQYGDIGSLGTWTCPSSRVAAGMADFIPQCVDLSVIAEVPQIIIPPVTSFDVPLSMTTNHETALLDSSAATYSGSGTAIAVLDSYGSVSGGKLTGAGVGVGIGVGANPVPAYHESIRRMEVTNFDTGVYKQYGFYGGYYDIDSHDNVTTNFRVSDTSIGNVFVNIRARGSLAHTPNGILLDDTNANVSSNTFIGGTAEGNAKNQFEIKGADHTTDLGRHVECLAPTAIAAATFTNGSKAITSAALFTSAMDQTYMMLDADGVRYWTRATYNNASSMTLDEFYQGTGGTGAASSVAGLYYIHNGVGTAQGNAILYPELASATTACPTYFKSGTGNSLVTNYMAQPVTIGAAAQSTVLQYAVGPGVDPLDLGSLSWVIGPQNTQVGPFWMNRLGIASPDNNSTNATFQAIGGAGQSTDIAQFSQRGVGVLFKVGIAGEVEGGTSSGSWLFRPSALSNGNFSFQPRAATNSAIFTPNVINQTAPLVVNKAGTGQSGSLQEWQNAAGTPLALINVTGDLTAHSIPSPGVIGGGTPAAITGTTITANTGVVTASLSGTAVNASANHAVCWKTVTTLGYCSTVVDAGGACTCN